MFKSHDLRTELGWRSSSSNLWLSQVRRLINFLEAWYSDVFLLFFTSLNSWGEEKLVSRLLHFKEEKSPSYVFSVRELVYIAEWIWLMLSSASSIIIYHLHIFQSNNIHIHCITCVVKVHQ